MIDETLHPAEGIPSQEVSVFVAQLDRLTSSMWEDISNMEEEELAWQPSPGMNTIGMLLAHIAIVEVYWIDTGVRGLDDSDTDAVLGIGTDDDGMPIKAGAAPPVTLKGKDIAFYDVLLVKARAHTHAVAAQVRDEDLERAWERPSRGDSYKINVRWVWYHILEHLAGHYGQILMLRHMYRNQHASRPAKV
jgi:uncharacterized damage-inducible protein DinB